LRPVSTPGGLLTGVVFCRYFSLGLRPGAKVTHWGFCRLLPVDGLIQASPPKTLLDIGLDY
jgi:hypothetical protein